MQTQIPVLDHGYVRLIESWGSDELIIRAARQSTNKGFLGWGARHAKTCPSIEPSSPGSALGGACNCTPEPGDEKLLKHLWTHKHSTPFEFAGAIFEIQAPIFVFREHHRHRTQSYAEMSARYTPLPDMNYIPSVERLLRNANQGGTNRQAGTALGALPLTAEAAEAYRAELARTYDAQEKLYQEALHQGVPKELARVHLPVGRYSRMWASANLRNWIGFLALRDEPSAQVEIQEYARAVAGELHLLFPRTLELAHPCRET